MPEKYAVDRADLVSVADAIRAKGETAQALVFPADFVSAVQNIQTGAEMNFEVVGGTTQPGSPKENTIWVNTDQEITGWSFSVEEPVSPAEGMVWIPINVFSSIEFNALKENGIQVYPSQAKQYSGSAWDIKETSIYQSGAWAAVEAKLYLFKSGEGALVPFYYETEAESSIDVSNTSIVTDFSSTSHDYCIQIVNKSKIDTSPYTRLYVEITHRSVAGDSYPLYLVLSDTRPEIASAELSKYDAYKLISTSTSKKKHYLDVSGYKESYFMGLWGSAYATIHNIWLE